MGDASHIGPGSTVRLKTGGPAMTVMAIEEHGGGEYARCAWFDEHELHCSESFSVHGLDALDAPQPKVDLEAKPPPLPRRRARSPVLGAFCWALFALSWCSLLWGIGSLAYWTRSYHAEYGEFVWQSEDPALALAEIDAGRVVVGLFVIVIVRLFEYGIDASYPWRKPRGFFTPTVITFLLTQPLIAALVFGPSGLLKVGLIVAAWMGVMRAIEVATREDQSKAIAQLPRSADPRLR